MRLFIGFLLGLLVATMAHTLSAQTRRPIEGPSDATPSILVRPASIDWDSPPPTFGDLPPMSQPAPKYRWEHVENKSLTLVGPWGVVWRFNFGPKATKPYFHPLKTADGRNLTWAAPPDHLWHYGLWHSWKYINQVNYWEEGEKVVAPGTTRIVEATVRRADANGASIHLRLVYHPAGKPDEIVMEDTVDLAIETPREDGSYRIVWDHVSAARHRLLLDRTPPPDEPNGKDYGGYGGLSFRASRFLTSVTILESNGNRDMAGQRQKADWASLTGDIDGHLAGVTLFDHPANSRHPTPWFLVMTKATPNHTDAPFWYMNAAIINDAPLELTPGHPLTRRYLVRIDNGAPSVAAIEDEFRQFSASQPSTPALAR